MLMARYDPLAFLLRTDCATTPTPNTRIMNVPKNSAAASLSMGRIMDQAGAAYFAFSTMMCCQGSTSITLSMA